jgi:hypothetical protein
MRFYHLCSGCPQPTVALVTLFSITKVFVRFSRYKHIQSSRLQVRLLLRPTAAYQPYRATLWAVQLAAMA